MQIVRLERQDFSKAARFYEAAGYSTPLESTAVVVAALQKDEIIGLVRLVDENGIQVLRGMQIRPDFQRKGLGTQLLVKLKEFMAEDVYCLPYTHLENFYAQVGFQRTDDLPPHLKERLKAYRTKRSDMIAMRRKISS